MPRRSWNLEGKEQQHTPKLDCATHTTDGPISRKGERKSPKLLTVEHATHRDQTRHVDLTQPKVMAGAAPKVAATVMAAEVTTAALVAKVHYLHGTRWKSSMIAAIVVRIRARNINTLRAPGLATEVGDPPLIWQLGYQWMVVLHATRRNLQIPTEAGRRTTMNR